MAVQIYIHVFCAQVNSFKYNSNFILMEQLKLSMYTYRTRRKSMHRAEVSWQSSHIPVVAIIGTLERIGAVLQSVCQNGP